MAKTSMIAQNNHRMKMVKKFKAKRDELRLKAKDETLTLEDRMAATSKLASLPRNSSATRVRHRCILTGRPRGNYRKFGLSRMKFREMANNGELSGVTKASW